MPVTRLFFIKILGNKQLIIIFIIEYEHFIRINTEIKEADIAEKTVAEFRKTITPCEPAKGSRNQKGL